MRDRPIEVRFVDAGTGEAFARSEIPLASLPESFASATTLHIRGEEWRVVDARPETAAEFGRTGELVLTLSRLHQVDPREILFTLPTLADDLPELDPAPSRRPSPLQLHEDDWRQVEFVSESLADVVRDELARIERIYRDHSVESSDPSDPASRLLAFREIHVRRNVPEPLPPAISLDDLVARLPPSARALDGIALEPDDNLVRDGFAYELEGAVLYGARSGGELRVLALRIAPTNPEAFAETANILASLMSRHRLLLVDWCRVALLGPEVTELLNHFAA